MPTAESQPGSAVRETAPAGGWQGAWIPLGLLWLGMVAWSLLRVSIPAVNEPHYLGKARYYWNPEWCAGDFFLGSSNPHLAFYIVLGWMTTLMSLPAAAVVVRIICLAVVAIGWQKLSFALTGRRWAGLVALPFFLTLQLLGKWSGEWLIGGAEGKVLAYGFLFWAFANWLEGRLKFAGAFAGLAVSFHPVVGCWGVIVMTLGSCWELFQNRNQEKAPRSAESSVRGALSAFAILILASLPGLVPALATIQGSDPILDRNATYLQVAHRLAHHLDPMSFPIAGYWYLAFLVATWLLLRRVPEDAPHRLWTKLIFLSIAIALVGLALGAGPRPMYRMPGYEWRMKLLKFYPFRLADLLLPLAVSFGAAEMLLRGIDSLKAGRRLGTVLTLASLAIWIMAVSVPAANLSSSRLPQEKEQAWEELGVWVQEQTPESALVQALDTNWGVKWFLQRAEYVNYKDVPQDSRTIDEWNRRLWVVANWKRDALSDGRVDLSELSALRKETGIDYVIAERFGPVEVPPTYSNEFFSVWALPALEEN